MADSIVYRQRRRNKNGDVYLASSITRKTPNQKELMDRLSYDPDTGMFTHLTNIGGGEIGRIAGGTARGGYWEIRIFNRLFGAHRLAWLYMTGELPSGRMSIDHVNGKRDDNRWANLRLATYEQQSWNSAVKSCCKSGLKGAWPCKSTGRWQSVIQTNGKRVFLGRFDTAQEAHEAWVLAATKARGSEWISGSINNAPPNI